MMTLNRAKGLGSVMGVVAMLAFVGVGARALSGCSSGASSDTSDGGNGNGNGNGNGAGGEGGASSDAGTDGDPFAACTGVDLTQKGTLDIDLKAVKVSGKVTLNGKALVQADSANFGRLTLTDATGLSQMGAVTASIDTDGTYHTTIAPGTYDVIYDANGQCNAQTSTWPCGNHIVKSKVTLSADGVLDVDIPSVKATGKVTLAGQAVPQTVALGYIGFADTDPTKAAGGAAVPVQSMAGSSAYAVNLVPGHYKVIYSANGCSAMAASTGPCNGGVLKADANLTSAGVLDLDVPVVTVKGKATLNGAAIPAQASRGSVYFSPPTTDAAEKGLGASAQIQADGTYAIALFPGTYDVGFSSASAESDPSLMPRNSGVLRPAQALSGNGTLDLDIPSVTVSGKVSLNGSAMPGVANPGRVSFGTSGAAAKGALGVSAAITGGTYKTVLLPGSYDVAYSGDSAPCSQTNMGSPPIVPCNGGLLKTIAFAKGQGGVLDLDVKTVKITGKVTLDQGALPELARISFSPAVTGTGAGTGTGFVVETQSTYSVLLMPGTYDVGYGGASCSDTMQTMPCNGGTIKEAVALSAAGALDVDIPTVTVTGKVTLSGKEPPATMEARGAVTFSDKKGGSATTTTFDVSGPMTYSLHILKGRYVVSYDANAQLCSNGTVSPLPCGGQVVAGCP